MAQITPSYELMLSYRRQHLEGYCCYVTCLYVDRKGRQSIVESRHLTGNDPEVLIDMAEALLRQMTLEHVLSSYSPF